MGEVEQAVGLLARTLTAHALVTDEGQAVLQVVQQYTRAWRLLLEYVVPPEPVVGGTVAAVERRPAGDAEVYRVWFEGHDFPVSWDAVWPYLADGGVRPA